jgi:hypothetical protein
MSWERNSEDGSNEADKGMKRKKERLKWLRDEDTKEVMH